MSKSSSAKKSPAKKPAFSEDVNENSNDVLALEDDPRAASLAELFLDAVKDLYWAENHLVKSLPKVSQAAGMPALKKAVDNHLEVTKGHVTRLEQIFALLDKKPQAKKCDAMEGLVMEGEGVINSTAPGSAARDLGLIMACQKVEHYEMASYRGLSSLASVLGYGEAADLLVQTLEEETSSDNELTNLSEKI